MAWGSGRRRAERPDLDLDGWRWQGYCDHLEDLGYDLWGGTQPEADAPVERPSVATVTRSDDSSAD